MFRTAARLAPLRRITDLRISFQGDISRDDFEVRLFCTSFIMH